MDRLPRFLSGRLTAVIIILLLFAIGAAAEGGARAAPCVGSVEIAHQVGEANGQETITLPAHCHFGRYFLTAESLAEGQAVIVNGWLHQGDLLIRTTFLQPPAAPIRLQVNYQVIP